MRLLADVLSRLLLVLWPRRCKQELLLDLGERKDWTDIVRHDAVIRLSTWLSEETLLPALKDVDAAPLAMPALADAAPGRHLDFEALGRAFPDLYDLAPSGGVGARVAALGDLLGIHPKTLANSLTGGLDPTRREHRWLLTLSRLSLPPGQAGAPGGRVFHDRSPGSVAAALAAAAGPGATEPGESHPGAAAPGDVAHLMPDASDALLVLSLLALWQRRRRPEEARAARGTELPRRRLPKPVSALQQEIVTIGQLRNLVELGVRTGGAKGVTLVALALDAALFEAHLLPHPAHRNAAVPEGAGEDWLRTTSTLLARTDVARLLGDVDVEVFRWRVARMRGWRDEAPVPPPASIVASHPYVRLALAIDARGQSGDRFDPQAPGYFMLLPQARRRGLLEAS